MLLILIVIAFGCLIVSSNFSQFVKAFAVCAGIAALAVVLW